MPFRDIVVVGASAGGVAPLQALVAGLPASYAGSVFVVLHLGPRESTYLGDVLTRAGPLPAAEVADSEPIRPGRIYVASPNRHLVVEPGLVRSLMGPKESLHRPSVDVLFRSAAIAYGDRVVGIVLSGALDDGSAGLGAIRTAGGVTVVQDPAEAEHASMPQNALARVPVEHVLPVGAIPDLLVRMAEEEAPRNGVDPAAPSGPGSPVLFSCPSCNGVLRRTVESGVERWRCRVGHAYTDESLAAEHEDNVERALWTALRILEERVGLQRSLAQTARERGLHALSGLHEEKAARAQRDVTSLRNVVHASLDETKEPTK